MLILRNPCFSPAKVLTGDDEEDGEQKRNKCSSPRHSEREKPDLCRTEQHTFQTVTESGKKDGRGVRWERQREGGD